MRDEHDSLVLTEDDYLKYLILSKDLLPIAVTGTLVRRSLLFLGFSLDDLAFRALFRIITSLKGKAALDKHAHVGVQVDPEEHSLNDVERARRYLQEEYFASARDALKRFDVYWGSAADFLRELRDRLDFAAGHGSGGRG